MPRRRRPRKTKTSALAECNAKFAGRRKPGGGYTYYDFMQDRTFDIAGPNPTPEEQKKIDEQYTAYLEKQRRDNIAAALMAKQQQQPPQPDVQQVSLRSETEKVPVPVASPVKQAARIRAINCAKNSFSCEWPLLSQSIEDLKKLFGSSQANRRRPRRNGADNARQPFAGTTQSLISIRNCHRPEFPARRFSVRLGPLSPRGGAGRTTGATGSDTALDAARCSCSRAS